MPYDHAKQVAAPGRQSHYRLAFPVPVKRKPISPSGRAARKYSCFRLEWDIAGHDSTELRKNQRMVQLVNELKILVVKPGAFP
jgi:hypothetical protein